MRKARQATEIATQQLSAERTAITNKNNKEREKAQLKQIRALRARFGGGFAYEGASGQGLSNTLG
jgi:hypothetical protein